MSLERTTDFHPCDFGDCRAKATEWRRPMLYCAEHAAVHDRRLERCSWESDCEQAVTVAYGPLWLCTQHAREWNQQLARRVQRKHCATDGCNHHDCAAAAREDRALRLARERDAELRDLAEDHAVDAALDDWRGA